MKEEILRKVIRTIPDYPKSGIQFRDLTTVFKDPQYFQSLIQDIAAPLSILNLVKIAANEARGFIIGSAEAAQLGLGFVPIRKAGKLPWQTIACDYQLEYGASRLEMHIDAIEPGERVAVIDDLVATGGSVGAAINLIQRIGGQVVACSFVIELQSQEGHEYIKSLYQDPIQWHSLYKFP